ncbi:hypothetical protein I302_106630 [Kwoniella bestiolae CBS 10118]|uniref:Uncharacterized protein n=1 Tax=Kwoniella bestiolae CBS 10118 TaxID=1296100 RepID=A0A1B9G0W0_9TREE|nr:hypothetical protein I302_06109 [Kwoniella bestiolae CBS 10118]OCF24648.1 hypothetical protein I302_06109 [Kwoniella bestiolae CBS 10118]
MPHPFRQYIKEYSGSNVHAKRLNDINDTIITLLEHHSPEGEGGTDEIEIAQKWFALNAIRSTASQDPRFRYRGPIEFISQLQGVTWKLRDHLCEQRQYELNGIPNQKAKRVLNSSRLETLEKGNELYRRLNIGSLSPEESKIAREWHFAAPFTCTVASEHEKNIPSRKALSNATAELNQLVRDTLAWDPSPVLSSTHGRVDSKKQVGKELLSIGDCLYAQVGKEMIQNENGESWDRWPSLESRYKWVEASSRWKTCVAAFERSMSQTIRLQLEEQCQRSPCIPSLGTECPVS